MILTPTQKQKIKESALLDYPNEMCGICTIDDFIHLNNISENPEKSFKINPIEYAKYVDVVKAIVHSHTKSIKKIDLTDLRTPSYRDMLGQEKSGLPWIIVGTEGYEVTEPLVIPRTPSSEYLGRQFMWYINDCYTLIMDYYKFEMGIELKGHDKSFDWANQETCFDNLFEKHISSYGFKERKIDDLQQGDILLLDNLGMLRNHLGIYHNGCILHQLGLSVMEPISNYYNRINAIYRYAS